MIHDDIANRLTNPEEAVRLDALKKVYVCIHMYTCTPSFLIRLLIVAVMSRSRFNLAKSSPIHKKGLRLG